MKEYECESCGKSFAQAAHLKIHILGVHEGVNTVKNHKCESCEKSFAHASVLKKHVESVHEGIRNHKVRFMCLTC